MVHVLIVTEIDLVLQIVCSYKLGIQFELSALLSSQFIVIDVS